jgi:hypothetical protein
MHGEFIDLKLFKFKNFVIIIINCMNQFDINQYLNLLSNDTKIIDLSYKYITYSLQNFKWASLKN